MPNHETAPKMSSGPDEILGAQAVTRNGQFSAARAWRDRVAALAPDASRAELLEVERTSIPLDGELITSSAAAGGSLLILHREN